MSRDESPTLGSTEEVAPVLLIGSAVADSGVTGGVAFGSAAATRSVEGAATGAWACSIGAPEIAGFLICLASLTPADSGAGVSAGFSTGAASSAAFMALSAGIPAATSSAATTSGAFDGFSASVAGASILPSAGAGMGSAVAGDGGTGVGEASGAGASTGR